MTNDSRKYMEIREGFYYLAIPNVETTARWFAKSYIVWGAILLLLGFGIGHFWQSNSLPTPRPVPVVTSTLEQQAAAGGAVIPFPSVSPSPPPLTTPPSDLWEPSPTEEAEEEEELNGCTSTNTSEESSPSSPQADSGQTTSTRFYRTPRRLIR